MTRQIVGSVALMLGITTLSTSADAHSMHREGMPVFCDRPSVTSVKSGSWSDPAIWSTRAVPGSSAAVLISHDVLYDRVSDAALQCVRIHERGRLRFATAANTRLTVVTLQILGTLEVGTPAAPVRANAEIVITDQPLDTALDPAQTGHGVLAIESSRVIMHGTPVGAPFVRLTQEPKAGNTTLRIADASGWQVGDAIVVPDTRQLRRADRGIPASARAGSSAASGGIVQTPHTEYVRIAGINGTTITLAEPLKYDHPGARSPDGALERLPMVGHLSRNVIIRSANPAGTRGHGFFMERANVDIRYTLWFGMGRTRVEPLDSTTFDSAGSVTKVGTNQIGRYPIHFHRLRGPWPANADHQFKFVGNVVWNCLRWCAAIHDSHYGLFKNNVLVGDGVGQTGAGLVWEQGNEYGNTVEDVFIADVYGVESEGRNRGKFVTDFGREGHGLWSNGRFSAFKNVHVFGIQSIGHFWNVAGKVTIPAYPGSDMVSKGATAAVSKGPVARTEGLEVGGATIGFEPWQWFDGALENVVARYALWHTAWGAVVPAYVTQGGGMSFEDLWIRGDVEALQDPNEWPVGIRGNINYFTRAAFKRADIQGMRVGIRPARAVTLVEDAVLRNYVNAEIIFNRIAAGTRIQGSPREYEYREFKRTHFLALNGLPQAGSGPAHVAFPGTHRGDSGWTLEPHFNVFRDSCFDGACYAALKGYFPSQDAEFVWPLTGLTNRESLLRYGISVNLDIAPCAASAVSAVVGGRLCAGVTPVAGLGFKLSQNSVEGGRKASEKPPADGVYTLVYDVCVETFEGECRGQGQEASRQWRVVEPSPVQLQPGRNWLTRTVDLGDGRGVRHSFKVDWTPAKPSTPPSPPAAPTPAATTSAVSATSAPESASH